VSVFTASAHVAFLVAVTGVAAISGFALTECIRDEEGSVTMGRQRDRRKRIQERRNQQKRKEILKDIARATFRGTQRAVMFLGMLVAFAGSLVALLAGYTVYAALLFAFGLFVGAALLKWDAR
jgi:ABC-type Na+ efflux pump permease subunit